MTEKENVLEQYAELYNRDEFLALNEEMTFSEYIKKVKKNPKLARNSFQYVYDMIMEKGCSTFERYRKTYTKYHFFEDKETPIFGIEETIEGIVDFIHGAAGQYGTERRVLLMHGPVGSSKSTIARRIKRGLEKYSMTDAGAWYTFKWVNLPLEEDKDGPGVYTSAECLSAMNENPIKLMTPEMRNKFLEDINKVNYELASDDQKEDLYPLISEGDLNPRCKLFFNMLLKRYKGDWEKVVNNHIVVFRRIHSEIDRIGIGTFQPKDEKNQDSTELTGDMDFSKISKFGSDSDPRAFNFDGEFQVSNRGVCEMIEMLKLDNAFLYDLLGVSQEHSIKPKKFSQVVVDELIISHSVAGEEPIIYKKDGRLHWATFEKFYEKFKDKPEGISVLAHNFENNKTNWTPIVEITRHKWTGEMVRTIQKWGVVETTPNHAIYGRDGKLFYPESKQEVMAVRGPTNGGHHVDHFQLSDYMPNGYIVDHEGANNFAFTVMPQKDQIRSVQNRAATLILNEYEDPIKIKNLITFLIWYATEGHIGDGQVVISQADKDELKRVQIATSNLSIGDKLLGHISDGSDTDSCYRLIFGNRILVDLAEQLCGKLSENKKLPDFIFDLSKEYKEHAFAELMKTDGSTKVLESMKCSEEYKGNYFRYKTVSPMLAAQVGFLSAELGKDYSVSVAETVSGKRAFEIKYCNPSGQRGGRRTSCNCNIEKRHVEDIWVYDIECEGVHNFSCGVGQIVCHNTNNAEFEKLKNNKFMEALRDRTVKVDVPYLTRWSDEIKVYEQTYGPGKVRQHIMPHTLEIAALFAILTRLHDDGDSKLSLRDKAKLYNGDTIPGWTEDTVKELRDKHPDEGMEGGLSARYVQDGFSNCLARNKKYVNVFHVMSELKSRLTNCSLISNVEDIKKYEYCAELAIKELDEILKNEVQRALVSDEKAIERLCNKYIDNVIAYVNEEKMINPITKEKINPDERLMRAIEEKIGIPEQGCDDFRMSIAKCLGTLSRRNQEFRWDSNPELKRALEAKMFEDVKDTVKLASLTKESADLNPELQEKIDAIKTRLIKQYGYNSQSASDVLEYVSSIFARGDINN